MKNQPHTVERTKNDRKAPEHGSARDQSGSTTVVGPLPLSEARSVDVWNSQRVSSSSRQAQLIQMQAALGNEAVLHTIGLRRNVPGQRDDPPGRAVQAQRPSIHETVRPVGVLTSLPVLNTGKAKSVSGRQRIQRFEAQHHEHVERGSLTAPGPAGTAGMSDAEASAVYFGNWSRDLNQAFTNNPVTRALGNELVFEILNVVAMQKFGRTLNPRDFGVYSPREHIDNPLGQINTDLQRGRERQIAQEGQDNQPATPDEDISSPEAMGQLFEVNAAGLPAYLGRSIQYIEEELTQSANFGRTEDGLMHLGSGLHTVEDLFAHSNFIEIGVGQLIREHALPISPELRSELDQRTRPTNQGGQGLQDPVETLSGHTDTGRPILTTGTFVTQDTLVSLSEALTAFLSELDPFGGSNSERSQATINMILQRYETLSAEGNAKVIVASFMSHFGTALTTQLSQWARDKVAGEAPQQDASWWQRGVAAARGVAGQVVGGAIDLVGGTMNSEWVQDLVGGAVTLFGRLPLTDIYSFVIDKASAIKSFFERIDQWLQRLPFYRTAREWMLQQIESLRQQLRASIQAAVQFVAQLIQHALAETQTAGTNIQQQIETQIDGNVRDPQARAELQGAATPELKIALLTDPAWCRRARIDPADADRLRQMLSSPEYARQGPSHSQIAKDHADSPFFGTAAILAGHADSRVRDLMVAVWQAEGHNATNPALAQNYEGELPPAIASRLAPPGTPESQMTPEQRRAEYEAAQAAPHYKELARRREGEALLRDGGLPEGEEDHGAKSAIQSAAEIVRGLARQVDALPAGIRAVAAQVEQAAPDVAAELRALAEELPGRLEDLAAEIEGAADIETLTRLAARLRTMARTTEGVVAKAQQILRGAAGRVEALDPPLDAVAAQLRQLAALAATALPPVAQSLSPLAAKIAAYAQRQARTGEQIKAIHNLAPVKTGEWSPELAASHAGAAPGQAGMSPPRQALFRFIRQELFAHPYDSKWWREPLLAWASRNQAQLEAYIRARNSERMHEHH